MSNRRLVLRRPTVCKSKDHVCGNCLLNFSTVQTTFPVNSIFLCTCQLACSPEPADKSFQLTLTGGAIPQFTWPRLEVGPALVLPAIAPAVPGHYLLGLIALNSQNCAFISEVDIFTV